MLGQPRGVLHGGGAVARTVEVHGAHPDPASEQGLVEGPGGAHVVLGLCAVGRQGEDLGAHLGGEGGEPVADAVEADELLDLGMRGVGAQIGVLGDELGGRGAGRLHALLLGGEFGLLTGEQDLHPDVRGYRPQFTLPVVGGADQGEFAERVQSRTRGLPRQAEPLRQSGHRGPRIRQHGPVDLFRLVVESQQLQHVAPCS